MRENVFYDENSVFGENKEVGCKHRYISKTG